MTDIDLSKATARPWRYIERSGSIKIEAIDVIAVENESAIADAALIVRAVNSFEAMREVVEETARYAHRLPDGMWPRIRQALALANGETDEN